MPEVIVVGDVDTDQFYVVPHLPTWDEGVLVGERFELPGGKGGNTAAALSRLGMKTGIIAPAGDDHFGCVALTGLQNAGVDRAGIVIIPGKQTYYCIMMLDETGEKAMLVVTTDLLYPSFEMVKKHSQYLASARHAHFIALDPVRMTPMIALAKQLGLSVSIDLDAAYPGLEACTQAIQQADVVLVNRQGVGRMFPGQSLTEAAAQIQRMGPKVAVVTAGSQGVVGCDAAHTISLPAFTIEVKDSTGAGDAFSGAFVYATLRGWDLEQSLLFASGEGALATMKIGGQSALSTESEVWDFIHHQGNHS